MIIADLVLDGLASKQEDNKLLDSTQAVLAEVDVDEVKAESDGLIRGDGSGLRDRFNNDISAWLVPDRKRRLRLS